MSEAKSSPTDVLEGDAEIAHRTTMFEAGHSWSCSDCGFAERGVLACTTGDGNVALYCRECHPYHDPVRYAGRVILAWMPSYPPTLLSHLVRLVLFSSRPRFATLLCEAAADLVKTKDGSPLLSMLSKLVDAPVLADGTVTKATEAAITQALEAATAKVGADIAAAITAGAQVFPDLDETLEVLASAPDAQRAELMHGLRLIPTSIPRTRMEGWQLGLATLVIDQLTSFANKNVEVEAPPELDAAPALEGALGVKTESETGAASKTSQKPTSPRGPRGRPIHRRIKGGEA